MTLVEHESGIEAMSHRGEIQGRRIALGVLAALGFALVTAVVTAMIDTPWFSREVPTTSWAWPSLIVASVLAGALVAVSVPGQNLNDGTPRRGLLGSVGMFLAVGCPVCNKIVLLALGSAGAMTWFAPIQPWLGVASIALLAWALWRQLRTPVACPIPTQRSAR